MTNIKEQFPTHEQIEQRAFEIYLERGGEDGQALEDWLTAEEECRDDRLRLWQTSRQPKKEVWLRANAAVAEQSRSCRPAETQSTAMIAGRFLVVS